MCRLMSYIYCIMGVTCMAKKSIFLIGLMHAFMEIHEDPVTRWFFKAIINYQVYFIKKKSTTNSIVVMTLWVQIKGGKKKKKQEALFAQFPFT